MQILAGYRAMWGAASWWVQSLVRCRILVGCRTFEVLVAVVLVRRFGF